MSSFTSYLIIVVVILIVRLSSVLSVEEIQEIKFVCPNNESIDPCSCRFSPLKRLVRVSCNGPEITQDWIQNTFDKVREVNSKLLSNQSETEGSLPQFIARVSNTFLNHIDLRPFFDLPLKTLEFQHNGNLTSIGYLDGGSPSKLPLTVESFTVHDSLLSDEGLGNVLILFSPEVLTSLTITSGKIRGFQYSNSCFLPGFSRLVNLEYLELSENQFEELGSGIFKSMSKLWSINLVGNRLAKLSKDAFLFKDPVFAPNQVVNIYLSSNRLSDGSFDQMDQPGASLPLGKQPIYLSLRFNQFSFISESNFGPFLAAHSENKLDLLGNPIVCDDRMKWLKNNRSLYETRVLGAECQNDRGQTVFNSTLIRW